MYWPISDAEYILAIIGDAKNVINCAKKEPDAKIANERTKFLPGFLLKVFLLFMLIA